MPLTRSMTALLDPFLHIVLALALGLLIGVQRGWATREEEAGTRVAGIRTFGLLGLAGGMAGALGADDPALAVVVITVAAGLILLGYAQVMRRGGSVSGTASLSGLLTLCIGFLATTGRPLLAAAIAAVTTLVLALRSQLHGWLRRLSEAEVNAIARFALISLAILPLLPDRQYGPYDAWNPRQLWLVVVLVSGFSFAGYAAGRRWGEERGTITTAAAGAMVSSTAVTAALATRLRDGDESPHVLTAGVATASVVMFLRLLVLAIVLVPSVMPTLLYFVLPPVLVSAAFAWWNIRAARSEPPASACEVSVRNPFSLRPALVLMAVVMLLSLVSRWTLHHFGNASLAVVLMLSGSVDVDSTIITMANLPVGSLGGELAGLTIMVPAIVNTLVKAGTAVTVAGWKRGWPTALPLVASAAAGLAMLPVLLL